MALLGHSTASASALIAPAVSEPSVAGRWLRPFSEGGVFDDAPPATKDEAAKLPTAASVSVSPDGTVMYWNGFEGGEHLNPSMGWDLPDTRGSRTRILDVRRFVRGESDAPKFITPLQERGVGGDLFCSDLRSLSDGRLFVVGGTEWSNLDASLGLPGGGGRSEIWGRNDARLYDPSTGSWTAAQPMHHKRWYPSLVTLSDEKLFVAGGVERAIWNMSGFYVNQTETFDPQTGRWTENGESGEVALPYYARLHLLPNGKVFYDATGQMWGPGGPSVDMAEWNVQKTYDPKTNAWKDLLPAPLGGRNGSFSAMLPLKPPYDKARIVIAGGTLGTVSPPSYAANNITELVEVAGDSVQRNMGPTLNVPRWHSSGVVLPSGEVIALNGADRDDGMTPGMTGAVRQAEMFDGERWVPLASGTRERAYHSTAVLLGDGSILVGGHAPLPSTLLGPGNDNYFGEAFTTNFRDPSFEIFQPPYLFRGPRPRLTKLQSGIALGERFKITTPDASRVSSVVLSRLPAVTHLADADQRTVELEFERTGSRTLVAAAPQDPAVLVPGHYYLFLMADNGKGPTPSRAAIVQVGSTDRTAAPLPFGS
jgi:hypothetical protein